MSELIQSNFRLRKSFAKIKNLITVPNLLKNQVDSFKKFLDLNVDPTQTGLHRLFQSLFPVRSSDGTVIIDYLGFKIGDPKYDVDECRYRGANYAVPLNVEFQLTINEKIPLPGNQFKLQTKEIRNQNVYFGEIHIMTNEGTFIVNGTERVVVMQLHRSPGLSYVKEATTLLNRAVTYQAKIIPAVGSWLVFEFDSKELCYVQIDTKRKLQVTTLLKALGYSGEEIIHYFYENEKIRMERGIEVDPETGKKEEKILLFKKVNFDWLLGKKINHEFRHPETGEVVVKASMLLNKRNLDKLRQANITEIPIKEADVSFFAYSNILDTKNNLLKMVGEEINKEDLETLYDSGIREFDIIYLDKTSSGPYIKDTLLSDKVTDLLLKDVALCSLDRIRDEDHKDLITRLKFKNSEDEGDFKELARRFTSSPTQNAEVREKFTKMVFDLLGSDFFNEEIHRQALKEIFRRMRPNEPATFKEAEGFLYQMLFDSNRYDLSEVGRIKFNIKLRKEHLAFKKLSYLFSKSLEEKVTKYFEKIMRRDSAKNEDLSEFSSVSIVTDSLLHITKTVLSVGFKDIVSKMSDKITTSFEKTLSQKILDEILLFPENKQIILNTLLWIKSFIEENILPKLEFDSEEAKERFTYLLMEEAFFFTKKTLTKEDIIESLKYLIDIKNNGLNGAIVDDIDHLSNRRVRAVGELVELEFKKGFLKIIKAIEDKMVSSSDIELVNPHELINPKPLHATLNEFFGSSQLSQFMDQTNPLSEITHKRRLSALGPSGLKRERAGYEVRDVHATHYGRICPIETPEGQNIGLISSLAVFAEINDYGFLESPYRMVENGVITNKLHYFSALEESGKIIAQAKVKFDENQKITYDYVYARKDGDFVYVKPSDVEIMDISTYQMVSVAASMIPFLQHDDANRALMGSNMQRQAVPLLHTEAPFIGTGMEVHVGKDSGMVVIARRSGVVEYVDANRIVVRADATEDIEETEADIYNLSKYRRSNQNTCINQLPVVHKGDRINKGDVLADGPATDMGEIALGRNIVVAFMPWNGYNYEDAILISEKVVKNDIFTSIHIEEEEVFARDVKLGAETITRDVPGAKEDKLSKLDESGIIRIGSKVKQDDILVGKITPRAEQQLTPEERLLRAIFGSKADEVKDTSLRVSTGISGTVIDVKIFTRKGVEKDARSILIENEEEQRLKKDANDQKRIIKKNAYARIEELVVGKVASETLFSKDGRKIIAKGDSYTKDNFALLNEELYSDVKVEDSSVNKKLKAIISNLSKKVKYIDQMYKKKIETLSKGDELTPGVRKMVKVILAIKRKLQVGDKMSGRHGNKGVVSRILAEEDLPYLPDGTPVEMVLNPLGVPSRMNIGQILEVHLGWAAKGLGEKLYKMYQEKRSLEEIKEFLYQIYDKPEEKVYVDALNKDNLELFVEKHKTGLFFANPVFDGITEEGIRKKLILADLPENGRTILFDGQSGEPFDQEVTVGVMYILKLHHLVDEKIHARSTGPYSLVTQQPLGGKAQFGGQRLGEMEVWALEAYGAAYILQEFLTVKSDDINGRDRMYEAIVKGDNVLRAGTPEAFNVLLKELEALCLKIEKLDDESINRYEELRREKLGTIID
ncbi:DNA-directed RNA polymerase subunit beta [bacterium]|nr:DNA-directed RNA polymerase subunit beta [bacterium]